MKALILEDNPSLAIVLKKTIEGQGWIVESSPSWEKVAHKIKNNKFQLILLDILLVDKRGVEILKILAEKRISAKIITISGLFDKKSIFKGLPNDFLKNCHFLKKPLVEDELLKLINKDDLPELRSQFKKWNFFFEKDILEEPLSFYFPETDFFPSKQLIPLLLSAHFKAFTGDIILVINSKPNSIHFYKGNIIKIISSSQKSFFGEILVEHGLSLTDDVKQVLSDKTSNKRIGKKLLEKELLSPHMLDFVLKEQMKIRLSEFMSHPSFQLKFLRQKSESFEKIEIEFNKTDFIDWLADSIQTELKTDFWKSFYFDIKDYKLSQLSLFNFFSVSQKSFFSNYNEFFKSLDTNKKIAELIKNYNGDSIKLLYFGLLIKSIYFKKLSSEQKVLEQFKTMSCKILSGSEKDILNLLASPDGPIDLKELKESYKDLTRQVHPDFLPKENDETLKKESEKALKKLTQIYKKLLKKSEEDQDFSKNPSFDDLVYVMDTYKQGIDLIKQTSYSEAFELLSKIKDHSQAPSEIELYILWANLKDNPDFIGKNRKKGLNFQKQINNYPIHLRTSYLFWFVKGLFYYKCREYNKAQEFFKKTLFIESSFSPAKLELLFVKKKLKEENKNPSSFFSFFKKSS